MQEKQPIDDLFARKLGRAELQPSADTWARLQAKQAAAGGTVRPLTGGTSAQPLWRYMAAAACLLLLGFGAWYGWSGDNHPTGQSLAERSASPKSQPQTPENVSPEEKNNVAKPLGNVAPDLHSPERLATTSGKPRRSIATSNTNLPNVAKQNRQERERFQQRENVAIVQQTPKPEALPTIAPAGMPERDRLPTETNVAVAQQDVATPPDVSKPIATPDATLPKAIQQPDRRSLVLTLEAPVVAVVEPAVTSENSRPAKKDGLGNVLRSLRRLKNGEVLARNNTAEQSTASRSKFGQLLNDVKESITND